MPPLRTYADITSILICLPAFVEYLSSSLPATPPDRNLAAYALKHSHSHRRAIIISLFIADCGLRQLGRALLLLSTPLFTETLGSPSRREYVEVAVPQETLSGCFFFQESCAALLCKQRNDRGGYCFMSSPLRTGCHRSRRVGPGAL